MIMIIWIIITPLMIIQWWSWWSWWKLYIAQETMTAEAITLWSLEADDNLDDYFLDFNHTTANYSMMIMLVMMTMIYSSGDNDCRGDYLVIPRGWGGTSPNNKAFGRDRYFDIIMILMMILMELMIPQWGARNNLWNALLLRLGRNQSQ